MLTQADSSGKTNRVFFLCLTAFAFCLARTAQGQNFDEYPIPTGSSSLVGTAAARGPDGVMEALANKIGRVGLACSPDATTLCLNNSRFKVQTQWTTPQAQIGGGEAFAAAGSGAGQAVAVTPDTGYFTFFSANNVEMVVKVVDGRALNSRFWVFAGGLTNVNVVMTVTDTVTGTVKTYTNPQGVAFQPIQDTNAFASAGATTASARVPNESSAEAAASAISRYLSNLLEHREPVIEAAVEPTSVGAAAPCAADATTLCLNNGRFKVQTQWTTPQAQIGGGEAFAAAGSGAGQAVALTSDTGYFWFFSANNVEMVVKVVTGCSLNSRFWVFAGGLTNVNVVMTVTDTQTGSVQIYTNPQGAAFQPIQDTNAFATCPPPAAAFAGTWSGQWVNNTFGSSGPASLVVTVDTTAQTFQATLTLGGNVFGMGAPPPQTFSGSYNAAGGMFTQTSPLFGNLTMTIASDGSITGSATNVPNPFISRIDFTGTATSQRITINYTITGSAAAGGGTAQGVLTLNHVS